MNVKLTPEHLFDRYRALDFAILDRVYTPVAHWAHDEFDVRALQIGRGCLFGLVVALALKMGSMRVEVANACIGAFITAIEYGLKPDAPPTGMANPRREFEQSIRLIWLILIPMAGLSDHLFATIVWAVSLNSYVYFTAVQDRPRKPRHFLQPALAFGSSQ